MAMMITESLDVYFLTLLVETKHDCEVAENPR